jgi:plastocyanin
VQSAIFLNVLDRLAERPLLLRAGVSGVAEEVGMRGMGSGRKAFGMLTVYALAVGAGIAAPSAGSAQGTVAGRISIQEKAGEKTADFANTVVYLEPRNGAARTTEAKAQMAINGRNFAPRVRVITVGSTVDYPNQDPFTHNVFSTTPGALFDLGAYGSGTSKSNQFRKPGAYPIYCNVHAKMTGYVVVVNTPWYTQSTNDGRWEVAKVPAGRYTLTVWHERAQPVISEIDIPVAGLATLETKLDASGYKEVAHKDKVGKDYSTHGVVY